MSEIVAVGDAVRDPAQSSLVAERTGQSFRFLHAVKDPGSIGQWNQRRQFLEQLGSNSLFAAGRLDFRQISPGHGRVIVLFVALLHLLEKPIAGGRGDRQFKMMR